ncbi:MAG: NAD(P)H-dependent oxidoreductase [Roseobacter sp.]|uniref:FMN-dependent NADH-azoreductase n=1 Tax=Alphaproteobacteria TaxID=28211 RepID=UPI0032670F49
MSANSKTILKIDASARKEGSMTRELADELVARLVEARPEDKVITRDVAAGLPFLDEAWIGANFTDAAERSDEQKQTLSLSDTLIEELRSADVLVIGAPIYNFGVPATLKTWIDHIARARETFRYSEAGPVGLLEGKKAYVIVASGGTKAGSEIDFATGYIKHVLGFVGITDVTMIAADQLMENAADKRALALGEVREAAAAA